MTVPGVGQDDKTSSRVRSGNSYDDDDDDDNDKCGHWWPHQQRTGFPSNRNRDGGTPWWCLFGHKKGLGNGEWERTARVTVRSVSEWWCP